MYVYAIVTYKSSSKTVCRGNDVIISCGYQSITSLVTWTINGTSYSQSAKVNSPSYRLNNPTDPLHYTLTVFSINYTTTFQCIRIDSSSSSTDFTITFRTAAVTVTTGK